MPSRPPTAEQIKALADLYLEVGHIYVTGQGYVHMHFYVSEKIVADYVARRLSARVRAHLKVYDVVVSKRKTLASACRQLLKYPFPEPQKSVLVKALEYSIEVNRVRRHDMAVQLREFIRLNKLAEEA
jgi:hypothetical protein